MRCRVGAGSVIKSGKDSCVACNKGVGSNSIKCTSCKAWIYKRCSGISGKLQVMGDFAANRVQMVLFDWKDWRRSHLSSKVARIWTVLTNSAIWATSLEQEVELKKHPDQG